MLIEDGAYAFLEERAPPPLAALAPELTVYVSGLSKSVATGLRVGMVHARCNGWPRLNARSARPRGFTPAVMTAIACGWIEDGTVTRLEAEKRVDASQRQALVTEILGHLKPVRHPASYFVWLPMPEEVRADAVSKALMREQILVSPAHPYATSKHIPHAIRLAAGFRGWWNAAAVAANSGPSRGLVRLLKCLAVTLVRERRSHHSTGIRF